MFIVIGSVLYHIIFEPVKTKDMLLVFGVFTLLILGVSTFFRLGIVGEFLALTFLTIFGYIGTFIIVVVGSALMISLLTGRSLFNIDLSKFKLKPRQEKVIKKEIPLEYYEGEEYYESAAAKEESKRLKELEEEELERKRNLPNAVTLTLDDEPRKPKKFVRAEVEKEKEQEHKEEPAPQINQIKISGPAKVEIANEEIKRDESSFNYMYPTKELLKMPPTQESRINHSYIIENSKKLEETLKSFGVKATVTEVSQGPTVTRYELSPGSGVKVSKISNLADDLALNLAARGIRIEAPIPGKSVVGVEVPNENPSIVYFSELIESSVFKVFPSKLAFAIGKDIEGKVVVFDIAKMPHLLIAGATGAGKSVCINTLIVSLLYKSSPDEVKLIMIDPKVVELSVYDGIPHLLVPVVTDPKKAAGALNWAVREMLRRYEAFATTGVRDLAGYNRTLIETGEKPLPQIVIIIDELSDLMMAAPNEVEDAICRLAQMARAAGLHLIIATQRPSVDVITGLIKANVPSRLAFSVSSGTDSRTILDSVGAEKLLGRGDMLFSPIGIRKPLRVQGAFISDKEVEQIVEFLKENNDTTYTQEMIQEVTTATKTAATIGSKEVEADDKDEFYDEAVKYVVNQEKASASMLQRKFRIGYQRASRLIESLETNGMIGPEDGSKPRKVLVSRLGLEAMNEMNENEVEKAET
ncbi:MAG: DNA translocase FtsK [Defluviitaleaceae bacterium]|nr:DNA translocase FtsK [Defluviitaleaceae bacterium]